MLKLRGAADRRIVWLIAAVVVASGVTLSLYSCTAPPPRRGPATGPVIPLVTTTTMPLPAQLPPVPHYDTAPLLRVWLSDLPSEPTVMVRGPCRLQERGSTAVTTLPRLASAKVRLVSGGFKLGAESYMTTALDIRPDEGSALFVNNTLYSGAIRIIRGSDAPAIINLIDVESYLLGVLGSEMPRDWPAEALRAQAVAARSYALGMAHDRAAAEWDMVSTVEDQVYDGGRGGPAVESAVAATAGQVLLHDNQFFPAFFHSTCGGRTDNPSVALGRPEYDFLEGVECPWCAASPYARWQARLNRWELARRLTAAGIEVRSSISAVQVVEPADGLERAVKLVYDGGEKQVTMADFRRAVGRMVIKSGRFECAGDGDVFRFEGRGLGHGAGMCQYGARGMAEAGKPWREILAYYYRNTVVAKIY